jgi:hypothetical protein
VRGKLGLVGCLGILLRSGLEEFLKFVRRRISMVPKNYV